MSSNNPFMLLFLYETSQNDGWKALQKKYTFEKLFISFALNMITLWIVSNFLIFSFLQTHALARILKKKELK